MKKLLCLLLIIMLSVSITACGSSKNDAKEPNPEPVEEVDESVIDFDPSIVLMDNEYATIELIQFYQEESNWLDWGTLMSNCIVLKVTNKMTEADEGMWMTVDIEDAYLYGEECMVLSGMGSSPEPGKSKKFVYTILYNTTPKPSSLENLNDLYNIEMQVELSIIDGDNWLRDRITETYDLSTLIPRQ